MSGKSRGPRPLPDGATPNPIELILSRLKNVKANGKGYLTSCPVPGHGKQRGDRNQSLSISAGEDERVLACCMAGCPTEAVLTAIDLTWADLMPATGRSRTLGRRFHDRRPSSPTFDTFESALASITSQLGPVTRTWEYLDSVGERVGVIARWNKPGGKTIRPLRRAPNGWQVAGMAAPRPLYGLPELAKAKRIYICEGEPAADAIRSLGLTATTSAGGCNAARETDWSPLGDKECVHLPDNDAAGEGYLGDVLDLLGALPDCPTVKIVRLPNLPPAGDAVDFIAARRAAGVSDAQIRADIERMSDDAQPTGIRRAPRLIWRPFPIECLPDPLREFVEQQAAAIGCDPSMIAIPALVSCAGAIGTTRQVRIKLRWVEPPIVWATLVSPSGTMKSPAHEQALAPLQQAQERKLREYQQQLQQFETDWERYEADLAVWKKKKWEERGERPKKPPAPICTRYLVQDVTVEGLAPILQENRRGVLLARDELAGWITGFNQYKPKGGSDVPNWLQLHRAGLLVIDRKTGPVRTIYVPGAAVSVCGTVQPNTLRRLLTREFFEAGLPARLLVAAPPVTQKRWRDCDVEPATLERFATVINGLIDLQHGESDEGEPIPIDIKLSPEARNLYIEWYDENAELIGRADDDDIRAVLAKIECYAIRLTLIIHCVKCVGSGLSPDRPIDRDSMIAGQNLARWFATEAERVYGLWNESDEDRDLRKLAESAKREAAKPENDGVVSVRTWQRARSHEKSEDAQGELHCLVTAGYGSWQSPLQDGPGRPGGPRYKPNDNSDTDNNAAPKGETGSIVSVRGIGPQTGGIADQQQAAAPPDDSDQREAQARQHVELQAELGLPIESSRNQNQRWAREA